MGGGQSGRGCACWVKVRVGGRSWFVRDPKPDTWFNHTVSTLRRSCIMHPWYRDIHQKWRFNKAPHQQLFSSGDLPEDGRKPAQKRPGFAQCSFFQHPWGGYVCVCGAAAAVFGLEGLEGGGDSGGAQGSRKLTCGRGLPSEGRGQHHHHHHQSDLRADTYNKELLTGS